MPVHTLGELARDDRPQERAEVDPHVEDREPGVPPLVALLVQRADQRADVGLEEAGADDDEGEAGVKERQGVKREREMAQGDDRAADEHAPVMAEPPVRDDPAEDRGQPDTADIIAVHRSSMHIREAERLDHVQDQEPPHPVIAEALPHLGEEQRRQPAGVAEPCPGWRGGRDARGHAVVSVEEFVLLDGLRRWRGAQRFAQPLLPLLRVEVVLALQRASQRR